MTLIHIHVEEPSMEETLEILLPALINGRAEWKIIDHGSKQKLLRNLPDRLRAYRHWPVQPGLLVLVDRDNDDCLALKQRLEAQSQAAGMITKTASGGGLFHVVNRIVVEELEAWFLGDLPALVAAYPGMPPTLGQRSGFRDPDAIGGTWEALQRVLQKAGHYAGVGRLPKIEVARRVAAFMQPGRNRSRSFQHFASGLEALVVAIA